jgi:hypothetical protein
VREQQQLLLLGLHRHLRLLLLPVLARHLLLQLLRRPRLLRLQQGLGLHRQLPPRLSLPAG